MQIEKQAASKKKCLQHDTEMCLIYEEDILRKNCIHRDVKKL